MVLQALAGLPVTVIAATAGRVTVTDKPANAFVADYLPGDLAAARSRLVICNGGSPTTQQALSSGTPVLGLASNLDQLLNMQAIAAVGGGTLLRAGQASIETVRTAAWALLLSVRAKQAAQRLATECRRWNAPSRFARVLAGLDCAR